MSTPADKRTLVQDDRFKHVHSDPRFQRAAKSDRKFQPDARFQKMFTDKSFNTNYKVDAWGRKIETGKSKNELLKYYDMDEETKAAVTKKEKQPAAAAAASGKGKKSAAAAAPAAKKQAPQTKKSKAAAAAAAAEEDDEDDDGDEPDEEGFDGNFMSDRRMAPPSSEDEDGGNSDDAAVEVDADADSEGGEDEDEEPAEDDTSEDESDIEMEVATEEEIIPTGETTSRRLAVMNLEWDRLSSVDLLVLFRSFVPQPAGTVTHPVRSVKVYPSEFGRQRMAEEAMYGPTNIYAGKMTSEEYKNKIQAKMNKVNLPVMEDEEEEPKEEEEDESERSDEEEESSESDSGTPKRKRVSFPVGTKASKKTKAPTPAATPAKPRKPLTEEEEADMEAEVDILAQPNMDDGSDMSDSEASSLPSEDEGNEFDAEKLRQYELQRLKYYYAIVDCDTAATAEQLYRGCDGLEFEHSSNLIDLRYVPDEVSFADEEASIRDQCSKVPTNYKAPEFYTQALQHTNVQLTWDRDDPTRSKLLQKKFKPDEEGAGDLKAYLGSDNEEDGYGSDAVTEASDSGSDDCASDAEERSGAAVPAPKKKSVLKRKARSKYLQLLKELKSNDGESDGEDNHEVSITFEPGLKAKGEEIARKALNKGNEVEESTWEKHLRERLEKKKAKKKARKEKLKGGNDGDAAAGGDDDSGDEIGGANAKQQSDLYEDDAVDYDPNDTFFQLSDEDELEAPTQQKSAIGSDGDDEDGRDDDSAISMSSESGEEGGDDDSAAEDDGSVDSQDEDDIDLLHGKAKAKRFFDDSAPKPKAKATPAAAAATAADKKKADKKRKRGGDDEDEVDEKAKAELELLLMDEEDTNDAGAGGYSLKTLLKQKKSATLAEAGGKRSKKAKRDAASAAPADEFKVDTQDSRFSSLFSNTAFSIDPTHPSFKQTEGTEQLLHEKARRRQEQEKDQAKELKRRKEEAKKGGPKAAPAAATPAAAAEAASTGPSLASLVASVKRKTHAVSSTKKAPMGSAGSSTAPASKRSKPDSNL